MNSLKFTFKTTIWEKYQNRPNDLHKKDDINHSYIWAKSTRDETLRICENYADYLHNDRNLSSRCSLERAWKEIPKYLDKLSFEKNLNAGTLHNYAVALTRGFENKSFAQLANDYPQVTEMCSRRGLEKNKSRDGVDALNQAEFIAKFGRSPSEKELLARVTGVRLEKLSEICPKDVVKKDDGSYTVYTFRDKGGKNNHAIISNSKEIEVMEHLLSTAKERAANTGADYASSPICQDADRNRGTYQEQRRFKMQSLYSDCLTMQEKNPDYRTEIRRGLLDTFRKERGKNLNKDMRRVQYDLENHIDVDNTYCIVNHNKVYFDHTFVMYVSVMANDHYRSQVTLENYLT